VQAAPSVVDFPRIRIPSWVEFLRAVSAQAGRPSAAKRRQCEKPPALSNVSTVSGVTQG
jgi:hypothetical protein